MSHKKGGKPLNNYDDETNSEEEHDSDVETEDMTEEKEIEEDEEKTEIESDEEVEKSEEEKDYEEEKKKKKDDTNDITETNELDECMYIPKNKIENEEDEEEEYFVDDKKMNIMIKTGDQRRTKPYITKYERVRILGERTQQLAQGAKPMIKNGNRMNAEEIAREEYNQKVIPLIIERELPDKSIEHWKITEFLN